MINKIDTFTPISNDEVNKIWALIKEKWENNLKEFGIKLPEEHTAKMYQLIYLYKYKGCLIHKDVISDFVKANISDAGKDQQVRHLGSQLGFNILNKGEEIIFGEYVPSGYHYLVNLDVPKQSWLVALYKRSEKLNATSFEDVKKIFNYKCATCGAKEGEPHRVTKKTVVLQQGHIDPNKALSIDNTLPQCEYCNQNIYKDDFVFTQEGYPNKINNPKYILRSERNVRQKMYELLVKEQLDNGIEPINNEQNESDEK